MAIIPVGTPWADNRSALNIQVPVFSPSAVGNLLVVMAGVSISGHTMGISDDQGNTWIIANPSFDDATNAQVMQSWYAFAKSTTATTITITNSLTGFISASKMEFSGVDPVSPLDVITHSASGSTGTPISPVFTPLFDDELVCAYCLDTITGVGAIDNVAAPMLGNDNAGDWSEYRVLVGRKNVPMTAAFVGSGAFGVIVATFKPALLSGPTTRNPLVTAKMNLQQRVETAAC